MQARKWLIIFFLLFFTINGFSQRSAIDSLLGVEQSLKIKKDTTHIILLCHVSSLYESVNLDSSLLIGQQALRYAQAINYKKGIAMASTCIGYFYNSKGNYELSLTNFLKAKAIYEEIHSESDICESYNSIGNCLIGYGKKEKALETFSEGYKYAQLKNFKDKEATFAFGIGNALMELDKNKEALEYLFKAKLLFNELNSSFREAFTVVCIAQTQSKLKLFNKAFENFYSAIDVLEKLDNQYAISFAYQELAFAYKNNKNYDKAIVFYLKARDIFLKRNSFDNLRDISFSLAECYAAKNDYVSAYKNQLAYSVYNDSIFNEKVSQQINEVEGKYEADKKQKEIKLQSLLIREKDAKIAESSMRSNLLYLVIGVVLLIIIILLFGFYFNRKKNHRLNAINQSLAHKNFIIEQKNKEITDSISYAKRIQRAILPTDKTFTEALLQNFVLYLPKDIIAGDFYWLEHKNNNILFAAADCTGHGVPGAMVSVLCNSGLNRSVRESGITDPGEILDKTREFVVQEFEKSDEEVKDGMDIALCNLQFDLDKMTLKDHNTLALLHYSGANNPLYIIRKKLKGEHEFIEIKPNKQPIGQIDKPKPFTTHTFELQKEDTIYIFTDGFADQFGGPRGKKLMYQPLRDLFLSIQENTMIEQKIILETFFNKWKGNLEQVDDVCIIDIRI